jgi:hypothetical protein
MATIQLPTDPTAPDNFFSCDLDGVEYVFRTKWNFNDSAHYLSLFTIGGIEIASGIKIVLGKPDLLAPVHSLLRPPGAIYAVDMSNEKIEAGIKDLGDRVILNYVEIGDLIVAAAVA